MVLTTRRRVLMAGVLAASGLAVSKIAQAIPNGRSTIALVLKSLADPFTVAMSSAAQNYQKHFASQFDLSVLGTSNELDTATQIRIVDDLIGAHTHRPIRKRSCRPSSGRSTQA
jgi:ribose transport system substrate-binding protein